MTKPGFIRSRLLKLFESDDHEAKEDVVRRYSSVRNSECYCGHTITCDCGDPGISELHSALKTNSISEKTLHEITSDL